VDLPLSFEGIYSSIFFAKVLLEIVEKDFNHICDRSVIGFGEQDDFMFPRPLGYNCCAQQTGVHRMLVDALVAIFLQDL
jgi:hypothetical protein